MNKFLYVAASILLSGCVSMSKHNEVVERLQKRIILGELEVLKGRDKIKALRAMRVECVKGTKKVQDDLDLCKEREDELRKRLREECSCVEEDELDEEDYGC